VTDARVPSASTRALPRYLREPRVSVDDIRTIAADVLRGMRTQ
jgi:hypothetical protein